MQYVWSPVYVDALVLRDRDTNGDGTLDERLWVVQDANYNVTALFDNSGNVVERYVYDPFGRVTVVDGGWVERSEGTAFAWHYLHQGGRYDDVSGLYHFRYRDYSPTLGRWTTQDPLGYAAGDVNLYRYLGNNIPGRVDPSGLDWVYPWDPNADWSDWRIGEALGDAWDAISGGVGGGVAGGIIGAAAGAAGAATVVGIVFVVTSTPLGWAAGAVIITGATLGGKYGVGHGMNLGSQENNFTDGFVAVVSDPGSYIVPYAIGCIVGARMYRVVPDGPYVNWPPLLNWWGRILGG